MLGIEDDVNNAMFFIENSGNYLIEFLAIIRNTRFFRKCFKLASKHGRCLGVFRLADEVAAELPHFFVGEELLELGLRVLSGAVHELVHLLLDGQLATHKVDVLGLDDARQIVGQLVVLSVELADDKLSQCLQDLGALGVTEPCPDYLPVVLLELSRVVLLKPP